MKTVYQTPAMKVRRIKCSHMLSESSDGYLGINKGRADSEQEAWSKEYNGDFDW